MSSTGWLDDRDDGANLELVGYSRHAAFSPHVAPRCAANPVEQRRRSNVKAESHDPVEIPWNREKRTIIIPMRRDYHVKEDDVSDGTPRADGASTWDNHVKDEDVSDAEPRVDGASADNHVKEEDVSDVEPRVDGASAANHMNEEDVSGGEPRVDGASADDGYEEGDVSYNTIREAFSTGSARARRERKRKTMQAMSSSPWRQDLSHCSETTQQTDAQSRFGRRVRQRGRWLCESMGLEVPEDMQVRPCLSTFVGAKWSTAEWNAWNASQQQTSSSSSSGYGSVSASSRPRPSSSSRQ